MADKNIPIDLMCNDETIDIVLNEHIPSEKKQIKEFVNENTLKRKNEEGETITPKKYKWWADPNYQNQAAYFIFDDGDEL